MGIDPQFWKNKKVLVTGHTGFKGAWLTLWLEHLGAQVVGLSVDPPTNPNLFEQAEIKKNITSIHADIRNLNDVKKVFQKHQPEIVFHLAAQSLVRVSYDEPVTTYETNVMGTLNILEAIRTIQSVKASVMITTDKCYENREQDAGYKETDAMGGFDPYSSSKGCAELLISSYRRSFLPNVSSVRAGNVIGGGDWAKDRLIPDILRSFSAGQKVMIRSPHSVRPWQHVLEPLGGYLMLAQKQYAKPTEFSEGWNFGPDEGDAKPVSAIVEKMVSLWGENASWQLDGANHPHEAHYLKLDCTKAQNRLGWQPRWNLDTALKKIVGWHKAQVKGEPARELCLQQIREFMATPMGGH